MYLISASLHTHTQWNIFICVERILIAINNRIITTKCLAHHADTSSHREAKCEQTSSGFPT